MDKTLLIPVFLPLVAGFVMLFLPNRIKPLPKIVTLIISVFVFVKSIQIFNLGQLDYAWSMLQIDNFKLDLLLTTTALSKFILLFAMGFGLLVIIYSLNKPGSSIYYGSILLTIGGSAGILLCNHLLFLLIFWEIVTASLYLLITTGGKNSNFAATKSFCDDRSFRRCFSAWYPYAMGTFRYICHLGYQRGYQLSSSNYRLFCFL